MKFGGKGERAKHVISLLTDLYYKFTGGGEIEYKDCGTLEYQVAIIQFMQFPIRNSNFVASVPLHPPNKLLYRFYRGGCMYII